MTPFVERVGTFRSCPNSDRVWKLESCASLDERNANERASHARAQALFCAAEPAAEARAALEASLAQSAHATTGARESTAAMARPDDDANPADEPELAGGGDDDADFLERASASSLHDDPASHLFSLSLVLLQPGFFF